MAFHPDNINDVEDFGALLPEEWFHIRVSKVMEKESKESGEPTVYLNLKVQSEPHVGRVIPDTCSLQKHALGKLKAYYKACDKLPDGPGHDPETLMDCECYVKVTHTVNKATGDKRMSISPFHIKPLTDGMPSN